MKDGGGKEKGSAVSPNRPLIVFFFSPRRTHRRRNRDEGSQPRKFCDMGKTRIVVGGRVFSGVAGEAMAVDRETTHIHPKFEFQPHGAQRKRHHRNVTMA